LSFQRAGAPFSQTQRATMTADPNVEATRGDCDDALAEVVGAAPDAWRAAIASLDELPPLLASR
jgi:hypothetical protein